MMDIDNMIISGIRIYFPKKEELLPAPEKGMRTFAITVADGEHFRLFAFVNSRWVMMGLPEFDSIGKAIMGAVRQGKSVWY
ncbi:hypothetical protein NGC32_12600 [Kluyvera cryocrescens]|uniref:hypothetical protein n=1 Tax=Kluyvera cryocrescens TaxID=580 RepID=UPI002DB9164C|nr:hypothetical protein [Kluyvera cryocrescens]MEB7713560.1 hypothetical protein [Kluyvera cryocrescens]